MASGPKPPSAMRVVEKNTSTSEAAGYKSAMARRTEARKAEEWIDQCMEEVVTREVFKRALSYMHAPQYTEVTHERHLNNLCGYALCGNKPRAPYSSNKRFLVSTRSRSITPTVGNDDEAFCSRKCAIKSNWVKKSLSGEAGWLKVQGVELLEDLEEKGMVSWNGDVLSWASSSSTTAPASPPPNGAASQAESVALPPTDTQPSSRPPIAQPPIPGNLSSLVESLSIVERATPNKPPQAPSIHPQAPAEKGPLISAEVVLPLPLPGSPTSLPLPLPDTPGSSLKSPPTKVSARAARRGAAALVSVGKIGDAVLEGAKKIEGVEESSDESESEEEWAREMGWGEGAEVDALFEEARRARELG